MPAIWDFLIRFITPLVLLMLLINDLMKEISQPYEGYPWSALYLLGHGWLFVALIASFFVAMRNWKKDLASE